MTQPLVHVLVINWNGLEHLEVCFESLLASSYEHARFVLIDNASTDGSVEFVRGRFGNDPRVNILACASNLGWSRGNNVGIEQALGAGAKYVVLLNNDTWTEPCALEKMVAVAEENPKIGALAPKMLLFDYPALLNSVGVACSIIGCGWDIGLGRLDGPKWSGSNTVVGVCGGACLFRADALRITGLLPTDYDIYLDDLDLCFRLWNAGYEIRSCPDAVVRHKFSATMGTPEQYRRKYYLNTRNRFRLIQRCFPSGVMGEVSLKLLLGEFRALGRATLDGDWWKLGVHVRSWMEALGYAPNETASRFAECRCWNLIERDRMFFPGVELPRDGWYRPRGIRGRLLRPMSVRATMAAPSGRLRLIHGNCYPAQGPTAIDVAVSGRHLCTLSTLDVAEQMVHTDGGQVEFLARRIFDGDDTREGIDFGGWIAAEPVS